MTIGSVHKEWSKAMAAILEVFCQIGLSSKREHQVMIRFPNWTYLEIQDGGLGPTLVFIDTGDM